MGLIDVKAAYQIAKADMEGRVLARCLDAGDQWVFIFKVPCCQDLTPGDLPITVDKATGKPGYLPLPDQNSFRILKAGKLVPVQSVRGRKWII